MTKERLEQVLDVCVDEVLSGRRTIEQCVADWPQYRAELTALLQPVQAVAPLAPARPDPQLEPERFERLMSAVAATPQYGIRVVPNPQAQPAVVGPRRSWWSRLGMAPMARFAMAPVALAAMLAVALVFSPWSTAQASATGFVSLFAGSIAASDGTEALTVADGTQITEGSQVETTEDAVAVLTFPGGATMSIDGAAIFTVEQMRDATTDAPAEVVVRQDLGSAWHAPNGAAYRVVTPQVTVVDATGRFAVEVIDGATAVLVGAGEATVEVGDQLVTVPAGRRLRAGPQADALPLASGISGTHIEVTGPFVTSLIAADGRATGSAGGVEFHQIPGVDLVASPDGGTRIEFTAAPVGDYALVLRRVGPGPGSIALGAGDVSRTLPLGELTELWAPLAFEQANGSILATVWGPVLSGTPPIVLERVVVPVATEAGSFTLLDPLLPSFVATPAPATTPVSAASAVPEASAAPIVTEVASTVAPTLVPSVGVELQVELELPIETPPVSLEGLSETVSTLGDEVDQLLSDLGLAADDGSDGLLEPTLEELIDGIESLLPGLLG